jgi:hypothetical protein
MLYVASFESRISGFFSTLFLFASLLEDEDEDEDEDETGNLVLHAYGSPRLFAPLGRAGRRYSSVVVAGTDPGPRVSSLQLLSRLGCPLQLGSAP